MRNLNYIQRAFNSGTGPYGILKGILVIGGFIFTKFTNKFDLAKYDAFRKIYFYLYFTVKSFVDKSNINTLKTFCSSGTLFLDCGAAYGLYSSHIVKMDERVKVFAFEPDPSCINYLRDLNKKKNNSFTIEECALGNENKNIKLFTCSENIGENSVYQSAVHDSYVTVKLRTLDNWLVDSYSGPLQTVIIKIDVQGAEVEVLQGARKLLSKFKNVLILFEYSPIDIELSGNGTDKLFNEFKTLNLTVYAKFDKKLKQFYNPIKCKEDIIFPKGSGQLGQVDLFAIKGSLFL